MASDPSATPDDDGYTGHADLADRSSDINSTAFLIRKILAEEVHTASLVKVMSCTNSGGVTKVGFVDVQPLVNQIDGAGKPTSHSTIYNLPYSRWQGGKNAVIMDPEVGDIGLAVFCSRDSTAVKNTGAQSNPGSRRRHSMADGMYFGGFLNAAPTQYVRFSSEGIELVSPSKVTVHAPNIDLKADSNVTITSSNLTHNGKNVGDTHTHKNVRAGTDSTGTPN